MARVTPGQGSAAIVFGVLEILMGIMIIVCGFLIKDLFNPLKASLIVGFITLAGLVSDGLQVQPIQGKKS